MRFILCFLVALFPASSLASDQGSNSADSSDGSGDSSDGSGDSSAASGDSSDNSNASSENSDSSKEGSSEQSSEESSKDSTDGSTDATSRGEGGRAFTIAGAIVLAAGGIACAIGFGVTTTRRSNAEAEQKLAKFLRRHHSAVVHDVVLARGPILEGWAAQWGFAPAEVERFLSELDGSDEQLALIEAMSKLEDPASPRRFAELMTEVMARTIGPERLAALTARG